MAKDKDSKRKLRNFLINPQYQLRYVFWMSSSGLVLTFLNSTVFYFFIRENYKLLVDMSPMEDEVKVQLYHELHHIVLSLMGFSTFFVLMISAFGLVLSHRTAGAMYQFKRVFGEVMAGRKKSRIQLRPNDDFADVAKLCNQMIDHLQKKS